MKKIAIISLGYLWFPCEPGFSRFFQIANMFVDEGWEVECITTSFQHFKKEPRDIELILSQNYPFKITFIDTPAYKKNIDIRRIISNKLAEKNLKKYLSDNIKNYDVVYVSIPANNISAMVTKICQQHQIPVVVDIEDLWPEAMKMVIKNDFIRNALLFQFEKDANITYKNASAVIGTSDDYTERAFKYRTKDIPSQTVYVGCNLDEFDEGVRENIDSIEKKPEEFWVTYAGSISTSYDIKTLIDAGNQLKKENVHVQILGTGSLKDQLEEYSKNMNNIHFWGFVPYKRMAAILVKSDILVNSFVKGAPQSFVNKIGDYLASGKPIINTLENDCFCNFIEDNCVGLNIQPNNTSQLMDTILKLKFDEDLIELFKKNSRTIALDRFDRTKSYYKIIKIVSKLVNK